MNTKLLLIFLMSMALISCKKTYKYVEKVEKQGILGGTESDEKEAEFKAENDTAAYLEAYKKFTISQKVEMDMKKSFGTSASTPLEFSVYDEKGNNISFISFPNKEKRENEIAKSIFSLSSTVGKPQVLQNKTMVDSAKIKELKGYFREK